jgi:hypothetical protein
MLAVILYILFLVLAAAFKAVADTIEHHYDSSIFIAFKNQEFWRSEGYKYVELWFIKTRYVLDAWHLAGSGMIAAFILSGIMLLFTGVKYAHLIQVLPFWLIITLIIVLLVIYGCLFILAFNVFYNRILRKKL